MSFETTNWRDTIVCLMCIVAIFFIVILCGKCEDEHVPVKQNTVNVDSLLTTNDSIKIVIKYIDSTKNEEVEKVLKLDNDSTLELFKQLVRE